jgi:type I restriction enzyme S subunit
VLRTKDGSIGRSAVVETNQQFCINQSVAVVWLRSCPINRKSRGVAIQHLSITDFAAMRLPIAPLAEQERVVSKLDELSAFISEEAAVKSGLISIQALEQSILTKALKGKLVPQDPNDEPASVTLERIRSRRAATGRKAVRRKLEEFASTAAITAKAWHSLLAISLACIP